MCVFVLGAGWAAPGLGWPRSLPAAATRASSWAEQTQSLSKSFSEESPHPGTTPNPQNAELGQHPTPGMGCGWGGCGQSVPLLLLPGHRAGVTLQGRGDRDGAEFPKPSTGGARPLPAGLGGQGWGAELSIPRVPRQGREQRRCGELEQGLGSGRARDPRPLLPVPLRSVNTAG